MGLHFIIIRHLYRINLGLIRLGLGHLRLYLLSVPMESHVLIIISTAVVPSCLL